VTDARDGFADLERKLKLALLEGLDVGEPIEHAPAELEEGRSLAAVAPTLERPMGDSPAPGQLFLVQAMPLQYPS